MNHIIGYDPLTNKHRGVIIVSAKTCNGINLCNPHCLEIIGLVHLQLDIGNYGDMDFYQMGMGQNRLAYYYIHILELSSINKLH